MFDSIQIMRQLVKGEYISPLVKRAESDAFGSHYVSAGNIAAGEVIVVASGLHLPDDLTLAVEAVVATWSAPGGNILRERCRDLCPRLQSKSLQTSSGEGFDEDQLLLPKRVQHNCFDRGLFPLAALFNHSCIPNCQSALTEDGLLEVRTISIVPAGAKLGISYLSCASLCLPLEQRQAHLQTHYEFKCSCLRCTTGDKPSLYGMMSEMCNLQQAVTAVKINTPESAQKAVYLLLAQLVNSAHPGRETNISAAVRAAMSTRTMAILLEPGHWLLCLLGQQVAAACESQVIDRITRRHLVLFWITGLTLRMTTMVQVLSQNDYNVSVGHEAVRDYLSFHLVLYNICSLPIRQETDILLLIGISLLPHGERWIRYSTTVRRPKNALSGTMLDAHYGTAKDQPVSVLQKPRLCVMKLLCAASVESVAGTKKLLHTF